MKDKTAKILSAVTALLLCASCIVDDRSMCPADPVVSLRFSFTHHNHTPQPEDLLAEWVDNLAVYIFDENERFVYSLSAIRASMAGGNTVKVELEPGSYKIVAWGNLDSESYGVDSPQNTRTAYTVSVGDTRPDVGDLFYGMASVDVKTGNTSSEISLIRNTHPMRIWLGGVSGDTRTIPGTGYSVRIGGSYTHYDFDNNPVADAATTYIPEYTGVYQGGAFYDVARFKVQRLYPGEPTQLTITRDGAPAFTDNLTDRILSVYDDITTGGELDRRYEYDLYYVLLEDGTFAFAGIDISDWDGPSMPGGV